MENYSDGLKYQVNSDSCSVIGIGTCADTDIVIPSSYNSLPVTSIGNRAFYDCDGLTSITIPASVTSIGKNAFSSCTGLTSVTIPASVTSIGDYAFSGCTKLTTVEFGANSQLTSIGNSAFSSCTSLTSITIPASVTNIGEEAFRLCLSLTSVTIPDSVTSIGEWAFTNCPRLTSVTIGNGVTSIGEYVFVNCDALTVINCKFANGEVENAPWGAENARITYTDTPPEVDDTPTEDHTHNFVDGKCDICDMPDPDYTQPEPPVDDTPVECNHNYVEGSCTICGAEEPAVNTCSECGELLENCTCEPTTTPEQPEPEDPVPENPPAPEDPAVDEETPEEPIGTATKKIEHFDLIFYPFKTVYGLNNRTEYTNSFNYTSENMEKIRAELALTKTIAHNIITPDSSDSSEDIACIKNYLKLKARVTTTKKVTLIEEAEILNNIYKAIYTNFNARQVEFGEEIPYETILMVLKNADYRIKEINLDEPSLQTAFRLANGSEEIISDNINTKYLGNKLYNKLARRNILAGKIAAFDYDQNFLSEYDKAKYPDYDTIYPPKDFKITEIKSHFDVGKAFNNRNTDEEPDGYVLKENEVIQFRVPNFKTTRTYPAYVNYFIKLNTNSDSKDAIPATFETLGDFLQDNWERLLSKETGVTEIRNVVTQETTSIDSLTKFNEVEALHGALFTKEDEGDNAVYTKATTYTADTNYYYVPLKPLSGQQSIFWPLNNWVKSLDGSHGAKLLGIYRTVGVQEKPFGRLIDEAQYKYLPAYNFGTIADDKAALDNFYIQVTHPKDSDDVKEKKVTADGLGQDAAYVGVPKDGEYCLKTGEYLLINYTDSKTDEAGTEQKTVVNKVYTEGDLIRANFNLIDSALYHNNHSYPKKDGFSFSGQQPEGMFTLGANEQIEIRDIVQVELKDESMYLYWILNSDDPNATSNEFKFTEDYGITSGEGEWVDSEGNPMHNAYTLKEGEYLCYTNSKKQDLVYYGSGTVVVRCDPKTVLRKYAKNGECSIEEIITNGMSANIPWHGFTFGSEGLQLIENQYISLTEGDMIISIDDKNPVEANLMPDESWNNWAQVGSKEQPGSAKYRLAEDDADSYLPKVVVNDIYWHVRSRLDFNMSKTTTQPLHRGDSIKITMKDNSDNIDDETFAPSEEAAWAPVHINLNYTCQIATDTINTSTLAESGLDLKFKVSNQSTPVLSETENLLLNNYANGEAKYTKFDFENLPADHEKGTKAFRLNVNIPSTALFGLIAVYYIKGDESENLDQSAYFKAIGVDKTTKLDTEIAGLKQFNTGEANYVSTKYLKAGLNILEVHKDVKYLEVYANKNSDSTVVFGNLDIVNGINPKLDYRLNEDDLTNLKTEEAVKAARLDELLKDIRDMGVTVTSEFYYNVPIQRANEIDLNPLIDEERLSSPLVWYDPNNVNRKFVISEIDADYLTTGITLTKASRA